MESSTGGTARFLWRRRLALRKYHKVTRLILVMRKINTTLFCFCNVYESNLLLCRRNIFSTKGNSVRYLNKIIIIRRVEGRSRSVIRSYGCDQEGRKLSLETGIKEVGFEGFPERCDRGTISYLEGERVPKNRGIVTERIGKMFD